MIQNSTPMMGPRKSACIIGGGFAGMAAAVDLDALGFKVVLYEQKPIFGGRAYAFKDRKTEMWVDNGQHLMMGAYHETIRLAENIGAKRHLFFQPQTNVPLISDEGTFCPFKIPNLPVPFNLMMALLRFKGFTFSDKLSCLKLASALNKADLSEHNVHSWLRGLGQSKKAIANFWEILTLATLNDDPQIASASLLAVVLKKGLMGKGMDSHLVLPRSHLNDVLANPARAYLELRGHELYSSAGVRKIHILDNKVQSVELETGEMVKADVYLSAVPFSQLLKLIPEGFVESMPYFQNMLTLKSAPIVSINLWFDQDVLPHSFVGVAGKKVHWYFNKNKIYDVTHPPYHMMGVVSGAYAMVDQTREEMIKIALDEFYSLFPKAKEASLIHALVNKEKEATLSSQVGLEQYRPDQKSPFENLYVLGDWTATGYPATIESAVLSARRAVDGIASTSNRSSVP